MNLEYPPRPEGTAEEQLQRLWIWLYRQIERLNAERQNPEGQAPNHK